MAMEASNSRLVLVVYPFQGHINPMLQLATVLHAQGFSITIIHPEFNSPDPSRHPEFTFMSVRDRLVQDSVPTANLMATFRSLNKECQESFRLIVEQDLQKQINRFQRSWGMDTSFVPSRKAFERAGRYDIARALEKWGGLHEVSRLLSLKIRYPNRQQQQQTNVLLIMDKNTDHRLATPTNTTRECDNKVGSRRSLSGDTGKWVLKLRDLDINWIEY